MYPEYGKVVKFEILESLGVRERLDMVFAYAKVRLDTGEEAYASFDNDEYFRIRDPKSVVEAMACNQLFQGPPEGRNYFGFHPSTEPTEKDYVLSLNVDPRYLVPLEPIPPDYRNGVDQQELDRYLKQVSEAKRPAPLVVSPRHNTL